MLRRIFVVGLICLVATGAFARVRPKRDAVVIKIKHADPLRVTFTQNDVATAIADRALTGVEGQDDFAVDHDSDVQIIVENPNPLLYRYSVTDKKTERTKSAKALDDFAKPLEQLAGGLKSLAGLNVEPGEASAEGVNTERAKRIEATKSCAKPAPSLQPVLHAAKFVTDRIADTSDLILKSYTKPSEVRTTVLEPEDEKTWDIEGESKAFEKAVKELDEEALELLKDPTPPECAGIVALALAKANDIRAAFDKLAEFKEEVEQLNQPLPLDSFAVTRSEFTTFTIHVEEIEDNWPEDLDNTRFVGDRTVKVFPDERVPISLQASMIYSFVDAEEFGTEAIPAGGEETGFRITRKDKETTGFDLAAGLEFAPEFLDFTSFNTVIQLSVSPQDHLGIFLGLGIKPADKFAFGAGIAFHQVDELGGGQTVGGVLAKEDDLKTEKKFKSGPYVFFSYKP